MEPEEVLIEIEKRVEDIKSGLPESGRRLKVKAYFLPKEYWDALLKNPFFKKEVIEGNPNLGGIPVKLMPDIVSPIIDWEQEEKRPKFYRVETS